MGSTGILSSAAVADLAGNPQWELVLRTVGSSSFRRSARLRDFLLYVGEAAVRGKTEELTEHHIGCAVFGRKQSYSPADDNTVRVHARQLRFRLEEHFRSDGAGEPLIIEIPKGSYVPVFVTRPGPQAPEPVPPKVMPAGGTSRQTRYLWIACSILLASCCVLAWRNLRLQQAMQPITVEAPPSALLNAVCEPDRVTTVVVPDSGFGTIQSILRKRLSLEDYLNPDYPKPLASQMEGPREQRILSGLTSRPYTTFGVLLAAARLSRLAERYRWNLSFHFARDVRVRDLNEGNVILLGSAMSNPWVSLYEKDLSFRSGWDDALGVPYFQNVSPQPGEQAVYSASDRNGIPGAAYGVASLIVNPRSGASGRSRVLILEGVNMEGTEAAVDFVCDAHRIAETLRLGQADLAGAQQSFRIEVMLSTRAMAGAARGTEVVATRNTYVR